ncbi:hypothetical protein RB195_023668 [Necator americanus]|uniref:Uncharacterized protein n=1 Tax=Necator americanus TaxID=51031 RepID=A0ABR1EK45_NECAM
MHRLLHCRKHASGIAVSAVSTITPSTAAMVDGRKVGGCAIAVTSDYNNLVEELRSTSSRCAFVRLRDRRGLKLWIVGAHALAETAEDHNKDAFYDKLNTLVSNIPSQQVVIVGIDANTKMGPEQQSYVL